jgi:hypothetical protein
VVVATASFAALARKVAGAYGLPNARIVVVEHPLGGIDDDAVLERAEGAVGDVVALVTREA